MGTRVQPKGSSLKWPRLEVRRFYTARSSLSLLSDEAPRRPEFRYKGQILVFRILLVSLLLFFLFTTILPILAAVIRRKTSLL